MKATRGRIPAHPPSAVWTLGHNGPIGRSVEDVAALLDIYAKPDVRDWNGLPVTDTHHLNALRERADVTNLRIGFSPTLGHAKVDPEVAGIVAGAAARFSELGANVEQVDAPLPDAREAFRIFFQTGIAHSLRNLPEKRWLELDPGLANVLEQAKGISRTQFLEAYEFHVCISREARLFHDRFDILLTPTVSVPAFRAGTLSPAGYDLKNWLDWAPFAYPFNLSGQPALTLNCGHTKENLPVGLQIVGPMYEETLVLRVARAYEKSEAASSKRPPPPFNVQFD